MDAYVEITLRPDPEFGQQLLLDALMGKLHRGLVAADTRSIGVSFPGYSPKPRSLGNRLRLHGTTEDLSRFMAMGWLSGMVDHVETSELRSLPENVQYRVVRRVQPKTNAARLRRRYQRRHGVTEEEARVLMPDSIEKPVTWPFVTIRSASTGQRFALFVAHGPLQSHATPGHFSAYGLSQGATVPWF